MALDAYQEMVTEASRLTAKITDVERRVDFMNSLNTISDDVKVAQIQARQRVQGALAGSAGIVDFARARFVELAEEIYGRAPTGESRATLRVGSSATAGHLKVEPIIRSDASTGIRSVQTFLLDHVLLECATRVDRWCGVLVHDSELFDGVDSEQIADCLNIGARIAGETGSQYLVTMNSDLLEQVSRESGGAFDSAPHVLDAVLGDTTDENRLFGMQLADWKGGRAPEAEEG